MTSCRNDIILYNQAVDFHYISITIHKLQGCAETYWEGGQGFSLTHPTLKLSILNLMSHIFEIFNGIFLMVLLCGDSSVYVKQANKHSRWCHFLEACDWTQPSIKLNNQPVLIPGMSNTAVLFGSVPPRLM